MKIGDKVKILARSTGTVNQIGDIGIIVNIYDCTRIRVQVAGRSTTSNNSPIKDLELLQIKQNLQLYKIL